MASARELLDIAAEYVQAKDSVKIAEAMGAVPADDLDEIAGRFDHALEQYVRQD